MPRGAKINSKLSIVKLIKNPNQLAGALRLHFRQRRRRQVGDDAGSEKSARSRYMMSSTMKILICLMKTWRYVEREKKRIDDDDDMMSERDSNHGNNSRGRGGCGGYGSDFQRNSDDFIEDDGDSLRRQRERYRGDDNIPESAEEDARGIFGVEDSNFFSSVKKRLHKKKTLLGFIEPSELERGFLSAADKKIMIEDAPERFKLRKTPAIKSNENEIDREAHETRLRKGTIHRSKFLMNSKIEGQQ
ncbi:hypothetical protein CAEBREN_24029 [Caenorhabditis brenneri]|uniref:Uncharacterized protein n=1 Tax=Caenorhabditis brenneri TaxID=135651 RepID=G0ND77_CAEBE|nr:hypothetical protein CAEBREN_24029 [Caenorhabditis brenneri]